MRSVAGRADRACFRPRCPPILRDGLGHLCDARWFLGKHFHSSEPPESLPIEIIEDGTVHGVWGWTEVPEIQDEHADEDVERDRYLEAVGGSELATFGATNGFRRTEHPLDRPSSDVTFDALDRVGHAIDLERRVQRPPDRLDTLGGSDFDRGDGPDLDRIRFRVRRTNSRLQLDGSVSDLERCRSLLALVERRLDLHRRRGSAGVDFLPDEDAQILSQSSYALDTLE